MSLRHLASFAGAVLVTLALPVAAHAGLWARAICETPAGAPAPIDGLVFSSQNAGMNAGAWGGYDCPGGVTSQPLTSGTQGVWASIAEDSSAPTQATWTYTAPAGSTIAGGSITGVQIDQITYGISPLDYDAFIATPSDQSDGADLVADCASPAQPSSGLPGGDPCAENPIEQGPRNTLNLGAGGTPAPLVAAITHVGGTQLFMTAACATANTDPCFYQGVGPLISMNAAFSRALILLRDNTPPTASGFGGSLVTANPVHGTAQLTLTATDNGSGIANVTVKIDGQTAYSATPSTNGGQCASVGTDPNTGAPIYDYQRPCPTSEQLDIPIDTTKLADASHDLQVIVQDAAGNSATVLDQTFTTRNLTTVASTTPETVTTATTGAAPAATPSYAFKLDTPSEKLAGKALHRRYLGSSVALSGTILTASGTPATGVSVVAQTGSLAGRGYRVVATTTTDGSGHFSLAVPRGDSRTIELVAGAEQVAFKQYIRPNVSLRIRSLRGQRLVFSGRVVINRNGSPAPIVELSDKTSAGWEAIANVPVGKHGRYRYRYTASPLAIGHTFAIRASTPAAAYWQAASSNVHNAKVI